MQTKRNIGDVVWVDLLSPTPEEARTVMEEYGIDPRATQDLILPNTRPLIERYGDFVYFVLHFPSCGSKTEDTRYEVDFILGKNLVLTTRYENIDGLHTFERKIEVHSMIERDAEMYVARSVFVQIMRTMYQSLSDGLESVKDALLDVENKIFKGEEKEMVFKLSRISRDLLSFKHSLDPHGDIFLKLAEHGKKIFGNEFETDIAKINSELHKIIITTKRYSESLAELRRTNDSLLETKQNEIMKIFTGITVISSVLTIISSWFLVESKNKPFVSSDHAFWYVGGLMLVVAIVLGYIMKKKKWL